MRLIFLGTGGGRVCMIKQLRWTGGIRILTNKLNLHLDPGPGALIKSIQLKLPPEKLNAILVSHAHPDHYTDAEVLIEAMTRGALKKRGILMASRGVLFGNEVCEAAISKHHQSMPAKIIEAKIGESVQIHDIKVTPTKAVHTDPDTVGFKFKHEKYGEIGYTSDTEYFENISSYYAGVRVLVLSILRPRGAPWKFHMSTDDAVKIVKEVKPELAVLTHFGAKMILSNPFKEAEYVKKESGVNTLVARDGMELVIEEEVKWKSRV